MYKRKSRCSCVLTTVELSYHVRLFQVKHNHCFTESLAVAAVCPAGEGRPVLDAALHDSLTLPGYTSTREDEGSSVVEGVRRLPVPSIGRGSRETRRTRRDGQRRANKGALLYGAATDRLPPATGNPGAVATPVPGDSGITQRGVRSILSTHGDYPGAGQAGATAPR